MKKQLKRNGIRYVESQKILQKRSWDAKIRQQINDITLAELSQKKNKLRKDIESCSDQQKRQEKQIQLKAQKREVNKRLKETETEILDTKLKTIEQMKD